jgi:hypothetical protein
VINADQPGLMINVPDTSRINITAPENIPMSQLPLKSRSSSDSWKSPRPRNTKPKLRKPKLRRLAPRPQRLRKAPRTKPMMVSRQERPTLTLESANQARHRPPITAQVPVIRAVISPTLATAPQQ